jgi:hypothetical protein
MSYQQLAQTESAFDTVALEAKCGIEEIVVRRVVALVNLVEKIM